MHQPLGWQIVHPLYMYVFCLFSISLSLSPSISFFFHPPRLHLSNPPSKPKDASQAVRQGYHFPRYAPHQASQSATTSVLSFPPSYKPFRLPRLLTHSILSPPFFSPLLSRSVFSRSTASNHRAPKNENARPNSPGLPRWNLPMWGPVLIKPNEASLHTSYMGISLSLYLYDDGVLL